MFVAVAGTAISPFLRYLIKDAPEIEGLTGIYFIFLADTVASYFFSYKRSLISADQRESVLSLNHLLFVILKSVVQIALLLLLRNFVIYLCAQVVCTLGENLRVSFLVNKLYPFLADHKSVRKLEKEEKRTIIENVKALFIYKAASVFLGGIDNLIISTQIGVICVAAYSNYLMIVGSLTNVINMFVTSITASIGNFVATESREDQRKLFERVVFVVFLLFGFSSICLAELLNPFIALYAGEKLLLSEETVVIIVVNFFIVGMMSPVWAFRTTMGLFVYGRWRPVISAAMNFALSMWFAQFWGIEGVLIATAISRITTNLWFDPYIVYKKGWDASPKRYYFKFILYTLSLSAAIAVLTILCRLLAFPQSVGGFCLRTGFVAIAAAAMCATAVMLNPDKQYYYSMLKRLLAKARRTV